MKAPYTIDLDMSFTSDNSDMNKIFENMENVDLELAKDGDNYQIKMEMDMEGVGADMLYTIIGDTIYLKADVEYMGAKDSVKNRATLTEDEKEEFLGDNSMSSDITAADFATVEMEYIDDEMVITCKDLKDEARAELKDMIGDQLGQLNGATVNVENVKLVCEIDDFKYDTCVLTCDYTITYLTETYTISMRMEMEYDYDDIIAVVAPSDASTYKEVDFDDITG